MSTTLPSATASLIARCLVLVSCEPALAHLVPPIQRTMAIACLAAARRYTHWPLRSLRWEIWCSRRWFRHLVWVIERIVLPGFVLHIALRKRCISTWIDRAIALGAKQLLVIGAGYDAIAARVALEHSQIRCIECDHPATQAVKRGQVPAVVCLVAADLATVRLREALDANGWDPQRPSVVVVEGVLMYLDEMAATALLRSLAQVSGVGSHLAATAMVARRFAGAPSWISGWLRIIGEPFRWYLPPGRLKAILERSGWRLRERVDHRNLAHGLNRASLVPARGEYLIWAERA